MLKKSANAIAKTYGKVFDAESLAASAPAIARRLGLGVHHRQHLYRTYINDVGSVSNSYALHHYIAEPRRIQMDQQPLASVLAIAAVRAQASLVNFLRTQIAVDVRTYRPEKYYMRGPGPKWREKNAPGHVSLLTTTEDVDAAVRLLRATTLG